MGRHPPCGGCGLKFRKLEAQDHKYKSPSLRRVWVEIFALLHQSAPLSVTLLAEGVV